jgi:hypothetical protein
MAIAYVLTGELSAVDEADQGAVFACPAVP